MGIVQRAIGRLRDGSFFSRLMAKVRPVSANTDEPVGDVYYGDCAEDYLTKRKKQEYWHLEQKVVAELLAARPTGIRVLDVPFGTGRFVPLYIERSMAVFGLDASKDMLGIAERELGEAFQKCDVTTGDAGMLPYADLFFPLIVCFRFLSHIVSFEAAAKILKEFHRVGSDELLLQLRVRLPELDPLPLPPPSEPMNDRLNDLQIRSLLIETGWTVERVVDLETREKYKRGVYCCRRVNR